MAIQRRPTTSTRSSTRAITSAEPVSANDVLINAQSEKEFQSNVLAGLKQRGYATWTIPDMRKTRAGLPDVIALGPLNGHGPIRLLFLELKRRAGRRRPKQREVIAYLQQVTTIDARFVEPADWPAILDTLGPPHA